MWNSQSLTEPPGVRDGLKPIISQSRPACGTVLSLTEPPDVWNRQGLTEPPDVRNRLKSLTEPPGVWNS